MSIPVRIFLGPLNWSWLCGKCWHSGYQPMFANEYDDAWLHESHLTWLNIILLMISFCQDTKLRTLTRWTTFWEYKHCLGIPPSKEKPMLLSADSYIVRNDGEIPPQI